MADRTITCRDCGTTFTFTDGEQEFYTARGLQEPQRCNACRSARKSSRTTGPKELHDAVCAQCGAACQVPFKPRPESEGGRPVLCRTCFQAKRAA